MCTRTLAERCIGPKSDALRGCHCKAEAQAKRKLAARQNRQLTKGGGENEGTQRDEEEPPRRRRSRTRRIRRTCRSRSAALESAQRSEQFTKGLDDARPTTQ